MTSVPPEINNFANLIEPYLEGGHVISFNTRYLTKPGDNYGSTMLAVSANIQNSNGNLENLEVVAKMPPVNELYWKLFKPERSCPTENSIYTSIAPTLEELQRNAQVPDSEMLDVFSKCYGARLSLNTDNNDDHVDKNALLILENLTKHGYKVCPRDEGFDYKHTLVILKNLAKFHALPIALRNIDPEKFENKILPYMKRFNVYDNFDDSEIDDIWNGTVSDLKKVTDLNILDDILKNIKELIDVGMNYMDNLAECEAEPFNTISHYDFWTNNMMILYDEKNQPIKIKMLDFQISQYESLAHDILFFLFSCVKTSILEEQYVELLQYYYCEFIGSLKLVGCPTDQYSFNLFLDEIKRVGPVQFSHILFMLKVLFMNKDVMPDDFADMNFEVLQQADCVGEKYYVKLRDFLRLYHKYGYINI